MKKQQETCSGLAFDADLMILGGGLAGSALAHGLLPVLHLRGWRLGIVDARQPHWSLHPSFDERSTALSFASQQMLERQGLWPSLASAASAIRHVEVSSKGQWGKARLCASDYGIDALGWVVPNRVLGQALWSSLQTQQAQTASALTFWLGEAMAQVESIDGGYRLIFKNGQKITTRLLIVADGYPSFSCRQLGIAHDVQSYHQYALTANLEMQLPHQNCAYERFTEAGAVALLPLNQPKQMALVLTLSQSAWQRFSGAQQRVFQDFSLQDLSSQNQWLVSEINDRFGPSLGPITRLGQVASYALNKAVATETVRERLVVVGNAAHLLNPIAGQGFNLVLRELGVLTQCLALADLDSRESIWKALTDYQQRTAWDQCKTLSVSHYLPGLFESGCPIIRKARSQMLTLLNVSKRFKLHFAKQMMGMAEPQAVEVDIRASNV